MPTTPMYRVRTVITGVAGTPYYLVGHFSAEAGTAQAAVDDWHEFITGSSTPSAVTMRVGMAVITEDAVERINPTDGAILGIDDTSGRTATGTGSGDLLPPATQLLTRWRTGTYVNRREVRGRTFIPGMVEVNSESNGTPSAGLTSANTERANELIESDDSMLVVWSKANGVWHTVVSASTWSQYAVLRSRRD